MSSLFRIVSLSQLSSVADTVKTAVVLFLVNRHLSDREASFWLLLLVLLAGLRVFENGTMPNWSRLVTFRANLKGQINDEFNIQMKLLSDFTQEEVYFQIRGFYAKLAKNIFYITTCLGVLCSSLMDYTSKDSQFIFTIALLLVSSIVSIRLSYLNAILSGIGRNDIIYRHKILGACSNALVVFFGVVYYKSIVFLSLGYLVNVLLSKIPLLLSKEITMSFTRNTSLHKLVHGNSVKLVVVNISALVIVRLPQIFGVALDGLEESADISWAITLCSLVISFLSMAISSVLPYFNGLIALKEYKKFSDGAMIAHILAFCIATPVLSIILFYGNLLVPIGFPNLNFPSIWTPSLLFVLFLFELHHSISALLLTCFDEVPFFRATLYSLFAMIVLNSLFSAGEIIVVLIIQMLVQLCYNNWFWHLKLYQKLKTRLS